MISLYLKWSNFNSLHNSQPIRAKSYTLFALIYCIRLLCDCFISIATKHTFVILLRLIYFCLNIVCPYGVILCCLSSSFVLFILLLKFFSLSSRFHFLSFFLLSLSLSLSHSVYFYLFYLIIFLFFSVSLFPLSFSFLSLSLSFTVSTFFLILFDLEDKKWGLM